MYSDGRRHNPVCVCVKGSLPSTTLLSCQADGRNTAGVVVEQMPRQLRPAPATPHLHAVGVDGVYVGATWLGGASSAYFEGFRRQVDHAPAGEEPQDAHARHLYDVGDLVGPEPGQGAEARPAIGTREVDAVERDGVQPSPSP